MSSSYTLIGSSNTTRVSVVAEGTSVEVADVEEGEGGAGLSSAILFGCLLDSVGSSKICYDCVAWF